MSTATCPYCNAVLPPAEGVARVTCPRCGESIVGSNALAGTTPTPPARMRPEVPPPVTRRRWTILAAVIILLAVASGVVFVWQTRFKSRSTVPLGEETRSVVRPVDLPGLGYLPASSDVVLAIQVPFLMDKLGPEAETDPAKALVRLGLPEVVVDTVEKASGVGLKNVEQLVVGVGIQKASLPPQLVVVVVTRQPYDLGQLLRKTKATTLKREGRTLHVAKTTGVINVHWWSPNDRVLIGTLQPRDFDEVPNKPHAGVEHFPPEIAELIRDRVADDSCAWLVASSDKWAQAINPYVFWGIPPFKNREDLVSPAERLRSVVVSVPQQYGVPVDIQIDLKTAAGGDQLRANLRERFAHEPIEVTGDGNTCRVTTPFDMARISSVLSRLLQEK